MNAVRAGLEKKACVFCIVQCSAHVRRTACSGLQAARSLQKDTFVKLLSEEVPIQLAELSEIVGGKHKSRYGVQLGEETTTDTPNI